MTHGRDIGNYSTSREVRTWSISCPSNHIGFFVASHSVVYMAYIAYVVTDVWCEDVDICDTCVCIVCV